MAATAILNVGKPLPTPNQLTNLHHSSCESTAQTADNTLHFLNRSVNNKIKTTSRLIPPLFQFHKEDYELMLEHFTFLKSVGKQQS